MSLQGESTRAGLPCFFVRLAGCNLRCRYCDTSRSWEPGRVVDVARLALEYRRSRAPLAEITGGEPLLQPGFVSLARAMLKVGPVLVETNGSCDIRTVPRSAVTILDIKCPSSGSSAAMRWLNLRHLRRNDEVKFVIGTRTDFDWARAVVRRYRLDRKCHAILFSPVQPRMRPARLGAWIAEARLPVRLQIQLHKLIGVP